MKKFILIILLSALTMSAYSQKKREPQFETAGEQEEYWTKQFFKKEYRRQKHSRFTGQIKRLDEHTFQFDTVTLKVVNTPPDLVMIVEEGLLQPWASGTTISDMEELTALNPPPTVKRIRFLLHHKGFVNPIVWFFELTNNAATPLTDRKTFIKGSTLTFLKQGWVRI
ncbi:MAG: hypothetical protein JSS79_15120 [Bacteroidetes bacterium]|nr:hypothetical protein [Bacteroidota bacterium]